MFSCNYMLLKECLWFTDCCVKLYNIGIGSEQLLKEKRNWNWIKRNSRELKQEFELTERH